MVLESQVAAALERGRGGKQGQTIGNGSGNGNGLGQDEGVRGTWIVIGASRGIGLEFVRQILSSRDDSQVIAVVRNTGTANLLWQIAAQQVRPGRCLIEMCDVSRQGDIEFFTSKMQMLVNGGLRIEGIILNAGILQYPNRATEVSFDALALHLQTNTIGPIIIAQKLLNTSSTYPPAKVVFISSDSGSTGRFLEHEDGFAAYGASKAALNQMLRHMAAELKRRGGVWDNVCVLAMHPGEVQTDMQNIDVDWDVEGIISAPSSVQGMLKVISSKAKSDSGTFWCWDGREHPW